MWKYFALLSALLPALTAILAKMGLKGVNSNVATAIRCIFIVLMTWGIVTFSGQLKDIRTLSKRNLLFLLLSGIATGLSWISTSRRWHWDLEICSRNGRNCGYI